MFLQPFLLGTLVLAWWSLVRGPVLRAAPLLLLALAGLHCQQHYVNASAGEGGTMIIVEHAEDRCSLHRADAAPGVADPMVDAIESAEPHLQSV